MDIRHLDEMEPFVTKDGSQIRELLAHRNSSIRNQSLAEAYVPPGCTTFAHLHRRTEEIYFLLEGQGRMVIDGESRDVRTGDAIAIPPGCVHQITNTGDGPLRFLCCCAPAYEHEDTVLADSPDDRSR